MFVSRENIPQMRAMLDDPETDRVTCAVAVSVLINSILRDGWMRIAATDRRVNMLLYEASETLCFDELSVRAGLKGVLNVMRELGMLLARKRKTTPRVHPMIARSSSWVRAAESGVLRSLVLLGNRVECRWDAP